MAAMGRSATGGGGLPRLACWVPQTILESAYNFRFPQDQDGTS